MRLNVKERNEKLAIAKKVEKCALSSASKIQYESKFVRP